MPSGAADPDLPRGNPVERKSAAAPAARRNARIQRRFEALYPWRGFTMPCFRIIVKTDQASRSSTELARDPPLRRTGDSGCSWYGIGAGSLDRKRQGVFTGRLLTLRVCAGHSWDGAAW